MFAIDKQYRQVEAALADQNDAQERSVRENDLLKRKLQDANSEKS